MGASSKKSMGFLKTMFAVWLALVLANMVTNSRYFTTTENEKSLCVSIDGFAK